MYDKRQSVITDEKERECISKLRYEDLTTKLNVNNQDNRMIILDRRLDHENYSQDGGGNSRRLGFAIKVAKGSSQEDFDAESHLAQEVNKYVYSSKT